MGLCNYPHSQDSEQVHQHQNPSFCPFTILFFSLPLSSSPTPNPSKLLCSPFIKCCHLKNVVSKNPMVVTLGDWIFFTWNNSLETHLSLCMYQHFSYLYCWIIFHASLHHSWTIHSLTDISAISSLGLLWITPHEHWPTGACVNIVSISLG